MQRSEGFDRTSDYQEGRFEEKKMRREKRKRPKMKDYLDMDNISELVGERECGGTMDAFARWHCPHD